MHKYRNPDRPWALKRPLYSPGWFNHCAIWPVLSQTAFDYIYTSPSLLISCHTTSHNSDNTDVKLIKSQRCSWRSSPVKKNHHHNSSNPNTVLWKTFERWCQHKCACLCLRSGVGDIIFCEGMLQLFLYVQDWQLSLSVGTGRQC